MASKLKKVKTYAFEPDLMNARMLYENIIRNEVSNLTTILPIALTNKNYCPDLFLKTLSYGDALHNIDNKNPNIVSDHEATIKIPAFTLDTIVETLNLLKPTKLKIDVDGVELQILQGAKKILTNVNSIIVEWSRSDKQYIEILNYLENAGFKLHSESKPHNPYSDTVNALFVR